MTRNELKRKMVNSREIAWVILDPRTPYLWYVWHVIYGNDALAHWAVAPPYNDILT